MCHCWGTHPDTPPAEQERGSNVALLISVEVDTARYSGIPLMSAIPVRVAAQPS
jgi:hypothetical protein